MSIFFCWKWRDFVEFSDKLIWMKNTSKSSPSVEYTNYNDLERDSIKQFQLWYNNRPIHKLTSLHDGKEGSLIDSLFKKNNLFVSVEENTQRKVIDNKEVEKALYEMRSDPSMMNEEAQLIDELENQLENEILYNDSKDVIEETHKLEKSIEEKQLQIEKEVKMEGEPEPKTVESKPNEVKIEESKEMIENEIKEFEEEVLSKTEKTKPKQKTIDIPQIIKISDLSKLLGVSVNECINKIIDLEEELYTRDDYIDNEIAELLALEYNFNPILKEKKVFEFSLLLISKF